MLRTLGYVLILAVAALGAVVLADLPGTVTLDLADWLGYEISLSIGGFIVAMIVLAIMLAVLFGLWRGLFHLPAALARWRDAGRLRRGRRALANGLIAIAAGDGRDARRQAARAGSLLEGEALSLLLAAQAAQLEGDGAAARRHFQAMADQPDTAFLGVRGLLTQALREGDVPTALELARRAEQLRPKTPWVQEVLFELQVRSSLWNGARETLDRARRLGFLDRAGARRKQALLLLLQARDAERDGRTQDRLAHLQGAHDLEPELPYGTVRLAATLIETGAHRRAARLIEKAWADEPGPDLAALYIRARHSGPERLDPRQALQTVQKLVRSAPGHVESRMAVAQAAIDTGDWTLARAELLRAVTEAPTEGPSARLCRLMARVEEGETGDPAAARDWLFRAAEARAGSIYECESCGAAAEAWAPVCGACGAFDSFGVVAVRGRIGAGRQAAVADGSVE